MKIAKNVKRIILAFTIATIYMASYMVQEYNVYTRLKSNGKIVKATSSYSEHLWVSYADYYFVTDEGVKISKSEKCRNREDFERNFQDLKLIYNKLNPAEFWDYEDFVGFKVTYATILMGLIPTFLMGFFLSKIFHAGARVLTSLKNDLFLKDTQ
jgi:hypothetical protein